MKTFLGKTFKFRVISGTTVKIYNYSSEFVGTYNLKLKVFDFASSANAKFTADDLLELSYIHDIIRFR